MIEAADLLQFSFVLPAGLTVIGWYVVAKQADRREFRKEVREQMKELRSSIDEVRSRAEAYWLSDDKKTYAGKATALSTEVKRLSRYLRNLESTGLAFNATTLMVDIRGLATGGNFQGKNRKRTPADEERIADLSGVLEDALSAVDGAFYREFAIRRDRKWMRLIPLGGMLLTIRG